MIIVRSPLRITLGGGGSDIPAYYEKYGGYTVSAAINKYVYVTITRPFFKGIFLKYSALERVERAEDVQHPAIREALMEYAPEDPQIEITSLADVPAGTGLGSSSSFTTALIKALCAYYKKDIDARTLAASACEIEIHRLRQAIGKQDQYTAAFGGINGLAFDDVGQVSVEPIKMTNERLYELEDDLLLFFTGAVHQASEVLQKSAVSDGGMLHSTGVIAGAVLRASSTDALSTCLNSQWAYKKAQSPYAVTPQIEEWRELGLKNGAIGGKLVGAGGGGFLLFYVKDHSRLRRAMAKAGLEELRFRFEFEGTKILVS